MLEREELFQRFLDCIQANEQSPDYLAQEPEDVTQFDPYQMVGEWIALRHEVKQQGKLLQSTQSVLQKALSAAQAEKEQLQNLLEQAQQQAVEKSTQELGTQKSRFDKEQEGLLKDILGIVDALDRACEHWQTAETEAMQTMSGNKQYSAIEIGTSSPSLISQMLNRFFGNIPTETEPVSESKKSPNLLEILSSSREGVELIRRMLVDILQQRQVVPIEAIGQPFDATCMYAVARQENEQKVENTVLQEVVRGYRWGGKTLREAQVIVAVKSNTNILNEERREGREERGERGEGS